MKKYIFLSISISVALLFAWLYNNTNDVSKEEYLELVRNHPVQERLILSKQERKKAGIPPNRYFDEQYLLEMDPKTGKTYPENLTKIKEQNKNSVFSNAVPGQNSAMAWEDRGPNNIGGRTRVAFYDPNDSTGKRVFAGGVSGGLWVNDDITDENSKWIQIGIDENLSISCYTIDPNDSNVWFVGTGESFTQDDGVGNGIWVTRDGGNTWDKYLGVDLGLSTGDRPYFVTQILAWSINGATRLFVSIDGGSDEEFIGFNVSGWWSLQDGALKKIPFNTTEGTPYVFSDVEIALDNSIWLATKSNVYGNGGGKVFRSTDGVNFTEKYSFADGGRVELSTSKQNANTVYVLGSIDEFRFNSSVEMVKTTDGTNFTAMVLPNDVDDDIDANDFANGQGFYNLTIEVDPSNDDILYAGGLDLFRSSNAGGSWTQISKWSNSNNLADLDVSEVHPDQHAVVIDPNNSNRGIFANDGGIYYSDILSNTASGEDTIEARNFGYNITQFYSAAIGQSTSEEMLMGGTQDNGSLLSTRVVNNSLNFTAVDGENTFLDIYGGDGAANFIDRDGDYLIVSYLYNFYAAYPIPFSNSSDAVEIVADQSSGNFINEADLDSNLDILYTNGTLGSRYRISRYTDLLGSPRRTNLTDSNLTERPSALKVSPYTTNSTTLLVGTEGGEVLKVTNADDTPIFTKIDPTGQINVGSISDVDFGTNEDEILVTLHNYGIHNIYYTANGGTTWTSKDGDFPDIPVKAIKMNPLNSNEVIIGTNLGVWKTDNFLDSNVKWTQSFNGMSNVKVTGFDLRTSDNTVIASTYGRGLFTGQFTNTDEPSDNNIFIDGDLEFNPDDEYDVNSESDTLSIDANGIESNLVLSTNVVTNQVLEISFADGLSGTASISISNAKGQILYTNNVITNQTSYSIPVAYRQGLYFITMELNGTISTEKFIIKD